MRRFPLYHCAAGHRQYDLSGRHSADSTTWLSPPAPGPTSMSATTHTPQTPLVRFAPRHRNQPALVAVTSVLTSTRSRVELGVCDRKTGPTGSALLISTGFAILRFLFAFSPFGPLSRLPLPRPLLFVPHAVHKNSPLRFVYPTQSEQQAIRPAVRTDRGSCWRFHRPRLGRPFRCNMHVA